MSTITIGRYNGESVTQDYAGWVEPADRSWIIFLGPDGKPSVYFADRDADGAVIGDGTRLD